MRPKRKRKRGRRILVLCVLLAMLAGGYAAFYAGLMPNVMMQGEALVRRLEERGVEAYVTQLKESHIKC